jgi:hypothetical protein
VQGRVVFPGAGYLEVARAAAQETALRDIHFLQPLSIEVLQLCVECSLSDDRFEVRSGEQGMFEDFTAHCSGSLAVADEWQWINQPSLRAPLRVFHVAALYDSFDAIGLQYGPVYRTLEQGWADTHIAVSRLRSRSTREGTAVHPADLDDALCTSAALKFDGSETRLPFAVDDAMLLQSTMVKPWAVRRCVLQASAPEAVHH